MDLRSVDLNLLVTLEAVVAERSVTRAATRLGVTQPAVSHALARLRGLFSDDLMVRGRDGLEPTERALELAAVLAPSLSEIEAVLERERGFDPATSHRRFVVHVSDYVAPFLLTDLCARVRRDAPATSLDVRHFRGHPHRVERGELSLQVAGPGAPLDPLVERERLLSDDYVVLMSRDHPSSGTTMDLRAYLELAHVKVSPHALGTSEIDEALARHGLRRRVAVTVPSWFEMRPLIAGTDLVVAMPRVWANDPAFAAGCVAHPLPLAEVTFAVDLCWLRRDRHDAGHRWMRGLLARTLGGGTSQGPAQAVTCGP